MNVSRSGPAGPAESTAPLSLPGSAQSGLLLPLRWLPMSASASAAKCTSISALSIRSASAFFRPPINPAESSAAFGHAPLTADPAALWKILNRSSPYLPLAFSERVWLSTQAIRHSNPSSVVPGSTCIEAHPIVRGYPLREICAAVTSQSDDALHAALRRLTIFGNDSVALRKGYRMQTWGDIDHSLVKIE